MQKPLSSKVFFSDLFGGRCICENRRRSILTNSIISKLFIVNFFDVSIKLNIARRLNCLLIRFIRLLFIISWEKNNRSRGKLLRHEVINFQKKISGSETQMSSKQHEMAKINQHQPYIAQNNIKKMLEMPSMTAMRQK